jgi:3-methyl-2-oxobutanoate hydroxymethyltransferase
VLLELVAAEVARRITDAVSIPTIGIGSGTHCDGQVLVTHDLIGLFPWFRPKFVSPRTNVAKQIRDAADSFIREIKGQSA